MESDPPIIILMNRQQRKVACVLDFPDLRRLEVMQTTHGWWMNLNRVIALYAACREYKCLKKVWEVVGLSEKEWRNFIKEHPRFNQWRKDYWWQKRYGDRFPYMPPRIEPELLTSPVKPNVTLLLRAEERVSVTDVVQMESLPCVAVLPHLLFKRPIPVRTASYDPILVPSQELREVFKAAMTTRENFRCIFLTKKEPLTLEDLMTFEDRFYRTYRPQKVTCESAKVKSEKETPVERERRLSRVAAKQRIWEYQNPLIERY
jgi:hypothetical protein